MTLNVKPLSLWVAIGGIVIGVMVVTMYLFDKLTPAQSKLLFTVGLMFWVLWVIVSWAAHAVELENFEKKQKELARKQKELESQQHEQTAEERYFKLGTN